jgi:hypothetical protein
VARESPSPRPAPTAQPSVGGPTAQPRPGAVDDPGADDAWARAKAVIDEYYQVMPYDDQIPARHERAAEVWADALATVCPPAGSVSCAPDTFAPVVWTDGMVHVLDTSLEVVSGDTAKVRAALASTTERYFLIDTEGREWTSADLENGLTAGEEIFTPPYVSDLVETNGAVGLWLDVEGNPFPDMARAQIRVLLEELKRAGTTEARIRPMAASPYK